MWRELIRSYREQRCVLDSREARKMFSWFACAVFYTGIINVFSFYIYESTKTLSSWWAKSIRPTSRQRLNAQCGFAAEDGAFQILLRDEEKDLADKRMIIISSHFDMGPLTQEWTILNRFSDDYLFSGIENSLRWRGWQRLENSFDTWFYCSFIKWFW